MMSRHLIALSFNTMTDYSFSSPLGIVTGPLENSVTDLHEILAWLRKDQQLPKPRETLHQQLVLGNW